MRAMLARAVLCASIVAAFCAGASAQELFTKPINVYVAGTAGGGIDLYARLLGRYLGRHIPGNPAVNVQDMPGAGGIRAANFLAETAPKDGTAIGTFPGGPLVEPLIGARNPGYDMSQFAWIGAISRDVSLCISWKGGPFATIDDAIKQEMIVAGTGAGSETDTFPLVLNAIMGTRLRIVTGYLGSKETFLAIENGEVHGRCGLTYSSLKTAKPDWVRDNKINYLLQLAYDKSPELPDVPLALDRISKPEDRQLLELLLIGTVVGRPFALPPGTPPAKVEALRRAFDATMKDPAFLEEGRLMQAEVSPSTGAEVQAKIRHVYATPPAITARAKALLNPSANK